MTQPFRSPTPVLDLPSEDALEFSVATPDVKPQPQLQKRSDEDAAVLMDEIFGEVEQVLDGSLIPPDEPVVLAVERPDRRQDIAAVLADRYPQLAKSLEAPEISLELAELPELPAPATALSKPEEKEKAKEKAQSHGSLSLFERFMIFTGCSSAIAALAVWLVAQGMLPKGIAALTQKIQTAAVTAPANNMPVASEVDVKFSEYMLRSLAAMDRTAATKPAASNPVAVLPAPIPTASTQPATTSGTTLPQPAPLNLPKVGTTAATTVTPQPVQPVAPVPVQPPADMVTRREMNQVMSRIVSMLERIAPGVSNRLPLPGVAPKVARVAKAPATRAAAKVAGVAAAPGAATAAPTVNLPQRTMLGAITGSKPSVMLELNGMAQTYYLGENIGSSGWTVIDIPADGDKAVFRRNGEVRTLGIGEKL